MKKIHSIISIACLLLCLSACQSNNVTHGFKSAFKGIGHLILSPIQIGAGVLEGISAMPFYLSNSIHNINKGMVKAQASITLEDTYDSAYGKKLSKISDDGNTGEVFRRMKQATEYFQKVLRQYGVDNYQQYRLTSVDTANRSGYTLFAVVKREYDDIQVIDKYNGKTIRNYSKSDRMYYDAHRADSKGRQLDKIIDWAGIPRDSIRSQKGQAVLITLAANSVVAEKCDEGYWDIEKRWMAGEFKEICNEKSKHIADKLQIENNVKN